MSINIDFIPSVSAFQCIMIIQTKEVVFKAFGFQTPQMTLKPPINRLKSHKTARIAGLAHIFSMCKNSDLPTTTQ